MYRLFKLFSISEMRNDVQEYINMGFETPQSDFEENIK